MSGAVVGPEHPTPVDAPVAAGPGSEHAGVGPADPSLDDFKTRNLDKVVNATPEPVPGGGTPTPQPDVEVPVPELPEVPVVVPVQPDRGIVWGRWQRVLGKTAKINLTKEQAVSELFALNGNYALFRTAGKDYVTPERGAAGFSLQDGEAFIYTDIGANRTSVAATLYNGKLNVDFGARTFTTSLSAMTLSERFNLQASGTLSGDGGLYGDASNGRVGYMDVKGVLSNEAGGTAAYIFDSRLDAKRTINGGTYWKQQ
jgi:hypothetical protein